MLKPTWLNEAAYVFATLPTWKKSLMAVASVLLFGGLGLKGAGSLSGDPSTEAAPRPAGSPAGENGPTIPGSRRTDWRVPSPIPLDGGAGGEEGRDARAPPRGGESLVTRRAPRRDGAETDLPWNPEMSSDDPGAPDRLRSPGFSDAHPLSGGFPERPEPPLALAEGPEERAERVGERPDGSSAMDEWSPTLIRGGFSFFAAFCIGYALRAFARLSLIVVGSIFLAISALAYWGYVEVHWDRMADDFRTLASGLPSEAGSFRSFLQGSLPSAAMCGLGLLAGIKKK